MNTRDIAPWAVALVAFSSFLGAAGCGEACPAMYIPSRAQLTLHLPPEATVAMPETATACREPDCATATLPRGLRENELASFTFTLSGNITADAVGDRVEGNLRLAAGGVRLLIIDWNLGNDSMKATEPYNHFDVEVKDAAGTVTGRLDNSVTYKHITGCGNNAWQAELTD